MFWSGNYIAVRELKFLLKEENVTLSQVLEADDILQECKADNKALVQFLTKPDILAELITLITEEPPQNVELSSQYRHANIACEVLTSHLSMLNDRLSLDATQMNRLCDFINREPPLNPLLASYFSKTVEMLLERSPKQDWYLYHIVCLRVLDFFKSRRDFLPNLLRHMSTSAIADTFKYFIRLDELFKKTVMEWLEEHQFLECLIQIICGTYCPEELPGAPDKAESEPNEKAPDDTQPHDKQDSGGDLTDKEKETTINTEESPSPKPAEKKTKVPESVNNEAVKRRMAAVASANAASLLCDLVVNGCAGDGCSTRPRTSWALVARLQSEAGVRLLLQGMFTSPPAARGYALVNGCQLLLQLLTNEPALAFDSSRMNPPSEDECRLQLQPYGECEERSSVELAVAPHLPLLHHALLHDPQQQTQEGEAPPGPPSASGGVGAARVGAAGLLAQLALSEVQEVPTTMLTLGTPGVLLDMFFKFPNNNFLHAQVYTLVKHALINNVYRTQYARHLFVECDLLTRLMDVFEENKNNKSGAPRAAYMGHVVLCLACAARALGVPDAQDALPASVRARWGAFVDEQLRPLLQQHDTPLGGYYPPESIYEVEIMADTMTSNYDYNDGAATTMDEMADDNAQDGTEMCGSVGPSVESGDFILDGLNLDDPQRKAAFLELSSQRFDDDMWDSPCVEGAEGEAEEGDGGEGELAPDALRDVLEQHSPWEGVAGGAGGSGEGWAQFGAEAGGAGDPFEAHSQYWAFSDPAPEPNPSGSLEDSMLALRLEGSDASAELANNLLTAMSAMSADAIANIVNANLAPDQLPDQSPDRSRDQLRNQSPDKVPSQATEQVPDQSAEHR